MADVPRIILTAHDGTALGDLDPTRVASIVVTSEVNGENAMTITTTQELAKGDRLLWRDGRGYWHEYVVEGAESVHDMHDATMHTYWCPWSVQHDLECTFVTGMPGTGGTPASARDALTAALAGTARWTAGTVGVTTTGSASFWRMSGWEAMQTLVEVWGGEVQATITVSTTGVVSRAVDLLVHVGASTASRRFDYGGDVSGITRTLEDQLWTARVMPLGAGEETTSGGYGRKITIESVNGGVAWLENASAVPLTRVPDGNGGWEVPVQVVENSECKTPAELKAWATAHLDEWTTPKVSYEADVVQLARAGMDALGVSLGDQAAVVDRTFGSTPLRIEGRVLRMEEDLLDPAATVLTVSNLRGSLASTLQSLARATADVRDMVEGMSANQSSVEWVSNLIARINDEANATGGYTYITEGQGTRTYDVAVSDPLVGAEASQVVEVKGGNIRIANTKDAQGNWEWKTMLQSGYVNSEVLRAMGSGSGGIAEVTANGLMVYLGQTLLASVMADAARYYDGQGIADANVTALFSAALMRMGYASGNRVEVTANGVATRSGSSNNYTLVDSDGFKVFLANAMRMALEGTTLRVYDGSGTAITNVLASFSETTVIGKQGNQQVISSTDGLRVATTTYSGGTYTVGQDATHVDDSGVTIGHTTGTTSANYRATLGAGKDTLTTISDITVDGAMAATTANSSRFTVNTLSGKRASGNKGTFIGADYIGAEDGVFDQLSVNSKLFVTGSIKSTNTQTIYGASLVTTTSTISDATTVSNDTGGTGVYLRNANDHNLGYVRGFARGGSDRERGIQVLGTSDESTTTFNGLYLLVDKDGNRVVRVSESKPWRDAINPSPLVTETPSAVSVATSSWSTLGSITVTQGIWVFSISTTFDSNSSGRRAVYFGTSSTGTSVTVGTMGGSIMAPAVGDKTKYSNCHIGQVSVSTTYYCRAWQNSGSTLSCQCYLRAVRIA